MPSKKQKHKGDQYKLAKENMLETLKYGIPEHEYLQLAKDQGLDVEKCMVNYHSKRQQFALTNDDLDYLNSVQDLMRQNRKHNYTVYFPVFDIMEIVQKNDVAGIVVKSKFDWTFNVNGKKFPFYRGSKTVLIGKDLLEAFPLVITDMDENKVLTKQTEFEKIETEKIVEKTKVITQERKTGIDQKKLDKAVSKTKHEMYKKWQPSAVDQVLSSLISNI